VEEAASTLWSQDSVGGIGQRAKAGDEMLLISALVAQIRKDTTIMTHGFEFTLSEGIDATRTGIPGQLAMPDVDGRRNVSIEGRLLDHGEERAGTGQYGPYKARMRDIGSEQTMMVRTGSEVTTPAQLAW
jgi:hypothetical protein